jgi:hypothetical protein
MSMQSEGKDAKGRNYDQVTKNGTSSAGSMGVGGTGDAGKLDQQGSEQRDSRTDDLLAGDSADQEADQGFGGGSFSGEIQTGMEGIAQRPGAGNRQSAEDAGASQGKPGAGRDEGSSGER